MKACIAFQRRFTKIEHEIALELTKKGFTEFCGYVYRRSSLNYLQNQTDIAYRTMLLDEDLEKEGRCKVLDWKNITNLEALCGIPTLWPYALSDRVLRYGYGVREYPQESQRYSHEELARIMLHMAERIDHMLEKEKPDLVYLPVVSAMGNMLLYHLAKKRNIPVLVGAETRINSGYAVSEDYRTFTFANKVFQSFKNNSVSLEEGRKYVEGFRSNPRTYLYVMQNFKHSGTLRMAFAWISPWRVFRFFSFVLSRIWHQSIHARDYTDERIHWYLIDVLRRKIRLMRGFNDLYDTYNSKEPFVYYPLHFEPELATLVLARHWTDQISTIKHIAESLPFNYKLYVKEHPAMVGYRTRAWYQTLKKIPNIKLIHPNHNSFSILKEARLVTTLTGTAGWEAVLLGKPVLVLGDAYYAELSFVEKCTDLSNIAFAIRKQLSHPHPSSTEELELFAYVQSLLTTSEDLHLHELWEKGLPHSAHKQSVEGAAKLIAHAYETIVHSRGNHET